MKTCTYSDPDSRKLVEKSSDGTFICFRCKGKISQRNNIERHQKKCKGEKPQHTCNLCDKTFVYKSKLDRHTKQVHYILSQNGDDASEEESDLFTPSFVGTFTDASTSAVYINVDSSLTPIDKCD